MRALFVSSVARNHVTPMVPLAWALRAAGHEVRIACQPVALDAALGSGMPTTLVGSTVDFEQRHRASVEDGSGQYYRKKDALAELLHEVVQAMAGELVAMVREWSPHLVIHDSVSFAAPLAARVAGVPSLRHLWGPDVFGTPPGAWLVHLMSERLAPIFASYGQPVPDLSAGWLVDPCPASLQQCAEATPLAVRHIPVDLAGVLPDWLLAAPTRTRVAVTWGTFSPGTSAAHLAPQLLRILTDLPVEPVIVVRSADRNMLPELPPDTRVAESVPLHQLLPTCAAVIHHGGANTLLGAAAAGVPQVVISQMFEPQLNGERLAGTGAGRHLSATGATDGSIRDAVAAVLVEPGYRTAAAALRAETLARPTPAEVVPRLELVARTRGDLPAGIPA